MRKDESDRIKKLFEDIVEISDRLEKFKVAGEVKKITPFGNSAHITLDKKTIGKKALVIILSDL